MVEFLYITKDQNNKHTFHRFPKLIPEKLLRYHCETKIVREIFFVETWRDLRLFNHKPTAYRAVRVSGILRQLLLEQQRGVDTSLLAQVNYSYNIDIKYDCNKSSLQGDPYPLFESIDGRYVKDIRRLKFEDLNTNSQQILTLLSEEMSPHSRMDFLDKVCFKYRTEPEIALSIGNIIFLMANFNGGIHFDPVPNFDEHQSFHLATVNPFDPNVDSHFVKSIIETSKIVCKALEPLVFAVATNLYNYANTNLQGKASLDLKVYKPGELPEIKREG